MRYFPGGGVGHVCISAEHDEPESDDTSKPMDDIDDVPGFATHRDIEPDHAPPEFDEDEDEDYGEPKGNLDGGDEDEQYDDEVDDMDDGLGFESDGNDELGADDGEGSDVGDSGYATA